MSFRLATHVNALIGTIYGAIAEELLSYTASFGLTQQPPLWSDTHGRFIVLSLPLKVTSMYVYLDTKINTDKIFIFILASLAVSIF